VNRLETYRHFDEQVKATKRRILAFLIDLKNRGKTIVGYGAPVRQHALNYCGIRTDILDYTRSQSVQARQYTPGRAYRFVHRK